jgi:DNA replication protein DnaC
MEKIGRHVAAKIRSIPNHLRTEEQSNALERYDNPYELSQERKEAIKKYSANLLSDKPKKALQGLKYDELYFSFKHEFKALTGKDLIETKERLNDYKTLLCYFTEDPRFFECDNLSHKSKPSFDKGLLIIGGFGNGKSSIMKSLSNALKYYRVRQFRFYTANQVIDKFEACETIGDKKSFWKTFSNGAKCFDDVKTERDASNYGKYNIFKDLIERRYDYESRTFITCNYRNVDSLEDGLQEFGDRYGARVYDRIFEMFNIIEFKGKSLRI